MSDSSNDYLRGLALTCAALTLLGVLALIFTDADQVPPRRHSGRLVVAGDHVGASPGADVPEPVLPLFPTTSTTRPPKATATTRTSLALRPPAEAESLLPGMGTYTYSVSGTEAATGGGTRALPSTMQLTAQRNGTSVEEVAFASRFSNQHSEREVIGIGAGGLVLRQESMTVTFGISGRDTTASYSPAMPRLVLPLGPGTTRSGVSEARDINGQLLRVEDWKITTVAERSIGWEVVLERVSRPGAAEHLRETRRAWFDPARRMWVKWETHLQTERTNGVAFTYDLNYTATLTNFTPA